MKKFLTLALTAFAVFQANADTYFGYAPLNPPSAEIAAQGTGKNNFIEAAICLDPATDPTVARLKGVKVKGLRINMRADYKSSQQASNRYVFYVKGSLDGERQKTTCKFSEGWNEVIFSEPVVIGDEPLYLGAKVYETFGTPYPFVRYTKASAAGAYWVNPDNEGWKSGTAEGVWLMSAILDESDKSAADAALANTAVVSFTDTPLTVRPDAPVNGTLYVKNMGAEPLSNVQIESRDDQGVAHTYTLDFGENPIPAYDGRALPYAIYSPSTTGTSVSLSLKALSVNSNTAAASLLTNASFYVMLDAFTRVPLVEEFTSQSCVNCPFMIYYLDKAIDQMRESGQPVLYVTHHSGFANDMFTQAVDQSLLYLFGPAGETYNPAVMYDRRVFTGKDLPVNAAQVAETTPYTEALTAVTEIPALASVKVEKSADGKSVTVSGAVNRNLVNEDIPVYITCYLIEDGIPTTPFFQKGLDEEGVPADLAETFRHNGVIRHAFTQKGTGDLLTVSKDGDECKYSVTYSYPDESKLSPLPVLNKANTDIVAFLHRYDKNVMQNNIVLNAGSLKLSNTEGIKTTVSTPSKDADGVYDLMGRRVLNMTKGLYVVNGKKVLKK